MGTKRRTTEQVERFASGKTLKKTLADSVNRKTLMHFWYTMSSSLSTIGIRVEYFGDRSNVVDIIYKIVMR